MELPPLKEVKSKYIHSIGHDGDSTMFLSFRRKNGQPPTRPYICEGVTPAEFSELANAPSIGRQFQHLRGRGLKCRAVLDDDVVPETA